MSKNVNKAPARNTLINKLNTYVASLLLYVMSYDVLFLNAIHLAC